MREETTFIASAIPTVAIGPAGGTVAASNPAAGTSATALLVKNTGGSIASGLFAANTIYIPKPLNGGGDFCLNPAGQILIMNPIQLAAPYLVCQGMLSLTPGSIATTIDVNP